jgi:hypothetical protein
MELGVADPVPPLDAPAVLHQLQQGFWGGAQAGEKQMGGLKWLAVAGACGAHLHDPAGAAPCLADVFRSLFGPQCPGDVAAVADLVIRCHKRDVALSLELAADLTMERLLVVFDRQEEVGPLLLELSKTVAACGGHPPGSARPPDPARREAGGTARSWFSPVA